MKVYVAELLKRVVYITPAIERELDERLMKREWGAQRFEENTSAG